MQRWKTLLFFTATGLLGLITAFEAIDVKAIALPLICHVPENAQIVADECTGKIVEAAGAITASISAIGIFLRMITTSPIFKSSK